MKIIALTSLIASLLLSIAQATASPVWKVTKDKQVLFLGGTFHLLAKADYPLPAAFDKAYQQSQALYFETDISALNSPQYATAMAQALMQPPGKTLQDSVKPATYAAMKAFLAEKGLAAEMFAPYAPGGFAITVSVLEMQKLGMQADLGVDQHFSQRATEDKKTTGALASPTEHIAYIAELAQGKEDEFILKTINDIKTMPEIMRALKTAWRNGDLKQLSATAIDEMERDFPEVYKSLLVERNHAWMVKIESMLQNTPVEFVLVGALHLAGDEGLVKLLRQRGYKVEKL